MSSYGYDAAVCVSAQLLYIAGATPDPRIAAFVLYAGVVVRAEGPPLTFVMPMVKNRP